jgi:hypothetical protein
LRHASVQALRLVSGMNVDNQTDGARVHLSIRGTAEPGWCIVRTHPADVRTGRRRMTRDILLVASGDLRLSANQVCWPAQQQLEAMVTRAFADLGRRVVRAHPADPVAGHGFLDSQARGIGRSRSTGGARRGGGRVAYEPVLRGRQAPRADRRWPLERRVAGWWAC